MRDDDLAFVDRVQRELGDVRWPEPVEIRARAQRRSRRTAALAALAVLTVASASAVAVAARPDASGTPSTVAEPASALPASGEPEPTFPRRSPIASPAAEIPLDVLLQAADVKAKTEAPLTQSGLGEGVQLDEMLRYCRKVQGQRAEWEPSRYSRSLTLLRNRPGAEQPPSDVLLNQDVYRVAPDVADRIFAEMAEVLAPCREWRSSGPTRWQGKTIRAQVVHSWQEVDRNFAGDESVLLRHTVVEARNLDTGNLLPDVSKPDSTAIVRVGDLVSVIKIGRGGTESDLRRLAGVAADRMCAAANPRC
ncbi:hypothetical protein ONA91_12875 [Micromonospora sp. DR5-3]|uniref:hypothetical protein n=1 Tax=unclassified Micromonospora TaxID=2617518 RepID=UPI0011D45F3C|nr:MULTISPECIES: hypothetical protein [unclassified Micromonospora]MCW3815348.1 hypothetical protein [Micromonospora sp. DR5-3]TYC22805.1 hypothetical protein FXF52_18590 [Micromonospora sp. MP36]